jgi:hypothetical protein
MWAGGGVAAVAIILGVFPLGALLAGLDREGRVGAGYLADRAWRHAGTLALLFGLSAIAQAIVGALCALLGGKVVDALKLVPPSEDIGGAVVALFVGLVVAFVGVVRDLGCAAAVRFDLRFYSAAVRAFQSVKKAGGRALFAWAWRAALGFAAVLIAVRLAPGLTGASAGAILVGVLLHQAALYGAAFAHASWLAAALGIVDAAAPQPAAVEAPAAQEEEAAPRAATEEAAPPNAEAS